jgi:hypothetical protein
LTTEACGCFFRGPRAPTSHSGSVRQSPTQQPIRRVPSVPKRYWRPAVLIFGESSVILTPMNAPKCLTEVDERTTSPRSESGTGGCRFSISLPKDSLYHLARRRLPQMTLPNSTVGWRRSKQARRPSRTTLLYDGSVGGDRQRLSHGMIGEARLMPGGAHWTTQFPFG